MSTRQSGGSRSRSFSHALTMKTLIGSSAVSGTTAPTITEASPLYEPSNPRMISSSGFRVKSVAHSSQAPAGNQVSTDETHWLQRLMRNSASGVRRRADSKSDSALRSPNPGFASLHVSGSRWSPSDSHQAIKNVSSTSSPRASFCPYWYRVYAMESFPCRSERTPAVVMAMSVDSLPRAPMASEKTSNSSRSGWACSSSKITAVGDSPSLVTDSADSTR